MATRFPNGLETSDLLVTRNLKVEGEITHATTEALEVASITTTGNAVVGGTLAVTGVITPTALVAGASSKAITVNCTDDYALTPEQKNATTITISASDTSKVLTLGMTAGQIVVITNGGEKDVTVKNVSDNTGVAITASKTAIYLVTAAEPIKIVETA
jgi:hypothetical protein